MLQIATGRLFTREAGRTNQLRGTLYTNAVFPSGTEYVEVATGRLLPPSFSAVGPAVKAVAYEFTERIELEPNGTPGILVSSGAAPYVLDFATLCSFALNCICSPDVDVVRRLTGTQPGVSTGMLPSAFVKRTFDPHRYCDSDEVAFLRAFVHQVIMLPRVKFLGAMRAIRTYVTAIHRVADDLEVAYALLVASVESLAQDFDEHQPDWDSLDERRRRAMDAALDGADPGLAERVRQALLDVEHVALARRFREFTLAHVAPSYFRQEAVDLKNPAARCDLVPCLREAYTLRSKYVHSLKALPHILTTGHDMGEVIVDTEGPQYLTIAGLARLMRHVIIRFVMTQGTLDREPYDYHLQRYGIGVYRLAPSYWVGNAEGDIARLGRQKVEGFIEQLSQHFLRSPDAAITDLKPVLTRANEFIPTITRELRRPYLALMVLFNWFAPEENRVTPSEQVVALMDSELELAGPCTEALLCCALIGITPTWPLAQHAEALEAYFRRRGQKNGYRLPRVVEAAITLELAERFRAQGDGPAFRGLVAQAAENHPGQAGLLRLESELGEDAPLRWREILLPHADPAPSNAVAEQPAENLVVDGASAGATGKATAGQAPAGPVLASGWRGVLAKALRRALARLDGSPGSAC